MRKPNPHSYVPGLYLPELDATVNCVRVVKETKPSADLITLEHHCCGKLRIYSATQVMRKVRDALRQITTYPRLCVTCMHSVARKKDVATPQPFQVGPTWPVPGEPSQGTYYADTR